MGTVLLGQGEHSPVPRVESATNLLGPEGAACHVPRPAAFAPREASVAFWAAGTSGARSLPLSCLTSQSSGGPAEGATPSSISTGFQVEAMGPPGCVPRATALQAAARHPCWAPAAAQNGRRWGGMVSDVSSGLKTLMHFFMLRLCS